MTTHLLFALALAVADPADTHPDLHLIPWPKSIRVGDGHMPLTAKSRVVAAVKRLRPLAEILAGEIALLTGMKLDVADGEGRDGDIVLRIDGKIAAGEKILSIRKREPVRTTDGAHTVAVGKQAIVTGFDYRATAEGSSTILQLLDQSGGGSRLPKVDIKDWPHADYCGVMLDVARQDHSIDDIKKVVRLCRLYKARYLQLHLTDDQGWTFPSTKFPKLGTRNHAAHGDVVPRVYKLAELKELVAWADARGVTLVPEFEMPGHSGAAVRAMPDVFDAIDPVTKEPIWIGCMNMSNEAIYPVLDTLIGEMCDVFKSSPYFHIGSDEVTSGRLSLNPGYKAFMKKHGLKDEHALADHFVRKACAMVKKHGKKAIKWEGLANFATKDVIVMCWESNSTFATEALNRGYTTITCPWNLGVPWEKWDMYRCNASQLRRGDSVLGATLVAWEQPAEFHINSLRNLALRQERTWGPDNKVTVEGFASRFRPLDAVAGKLLGKPIRPRLEADFSTSVGTRGFLEPAFALDGDDATYWQSDAVPMAGDHFTVTFKAPRLVHGIEVLTGINGRGLLNGGEVQLSADGKEFTTVGKLVKGVARAVLKDGRVRAVRVRAAKQGEPMVVRAINLRLLVELAGEVQGGDSAVGVGNVAALKGDARLTRLPENCEVPVINRGFTLRIDASARPCAWGGAITGRGKVEITAGGRGAPLTLGGKEPNTMQGEWAVRSGHVVLGKPAGVDAVAGTVTVDGGLHWGGDGQVSDVAHIKLVGEGKGAGELHLNGFSDSIARLTVGAGAKVFTDGAAGGGVLTVNELWFDGKRMPRGVYSSSAGWLHGSGLVVAGGVKAVDVAGVVDDPNKVIGEGNIARLKGAATLKLPEGDCSAHVINRGQVLTLAGGGKTRYSGLITGDGAVRIEGPLEIVGRHANTYRGATTLARGVLRLNKRDGMIAIPGDLALGGSAVENKGDGVIFAADGQIHPSAAVTLQGSQPSFLDLGGQKAALGKLALSKAAVIRLGDGGALRVKQLFVDGKRLKDGAYTAPLQWLKGKGTVTVDARVNVKGTIGSPETTVGAGNIANLVGDTRFSYPAGGCNVDVVTNGFTLTLDSGDGNNFSVTGAISGKGDVQFFMGPSHTGHRDTPMIVDGDRPNTATGKFRVRKGRVYLAKPRGVDAISGDVIVGGQGFNDCLFWGQSDQIKDSAGITLLDAGRNGAAYLDLNGHRETAASLTMTARNRVRTDGPKGEVGTLTVKSLTVGGVKKRAGEYTAATEKWIEGKGKVVVRP